MTFVSDYQMTEEQLEESVHDMVDWLENPDNDHEGVAISADYDGILCADLPDGRTVCGNVYLRAMTRCVSKMRELQDQ